MNIEPSVLDRLNIRSRTIVHCCINWYRQDPSRCLFLIRVLQRRVGYSLRVVDWFVTNYCKRSALCVPYSGTPISIYYDYERHLTVYNKRYFDPFARREKIEVTVQGQTVVTTVGQLNFFRWFFERGLDSVVKLHQKAIESDMKEGVNKKDISLATSTIYHGEFQLGFL